MTREALSSDQKEQTIAALDRMNTTDLVGISHSALKLLLRRVAGKVILCGPAEAKMFVTAAEFIAAVEAFAEEEK